MTRGFLCMLCGMVIISNVYAQSADINKATVQDFFQNQQFDEAINYLNPALPADSGNLQVLNYLGYAYYMNDDIRNAEKCYASMLTIDSNNVTANIYLASINNNPHPDKAQLYYRRLVKLQPKKASYYKSIGDLFRRNNLPDSALVYYEEAYHLAPNDSRNGVALADILIDQKKYPMADGIVEGILAKDSLNTSALKIQVRSAYEAKEYQNALVPGEKLIELNEVAVSHLTYLLLSYFNLKMYEECIKVAEYMKSKNIASESVLYYEARAWARLNKYDKSNELLKTCITSAISKDAELYYYNLAENYEALKQYKTALSQYDTAYYLFKNPVMIYNCGRISESGLKNTKLAQKYYSRYLKLAKPDNAEEKKAYDYVKKKLAQK